MKGWTESDIEDLRGDAEVRDEDTTKRPPALQGVARGSTPRREMNQTEQRWATLLDHSEDVLWWEYEAIRVHYGDNGWHTPDFIVLRLNGFIEVHETKGGHCTDAGRSRFKAGAKALPIARWVLVQQKSPQQPWELIYDTAGEDGRPFIQRDTE